LNYVLQIEIRLAVPNDVYFFAAQFSVILGAKIGNYYSATGISKSLMGIFKTNRTVQSLNEWSINTIASLIGIEFTAMGDDFLEAKMPVDHRTHQPLGLLHGGASVTLAETLGSVAATLCVDETKQFLRWSRNKRQPHPKREKWLCQRNCQTTSHRKEDAGMGDPHFNNRRRTSMHQQDNYGCA
jgi:hypothetical protein